MIIKFTYFILLDTRDMNTTNKICTGKSNSKLKPINFVTLHRIIDKIKIHNLIFFLSSIWKSSIIDKMKCIDLINKSRLVTSVSIDLSIYIIKSCKKLDIYFSIQFIYWEGKFCDKILWKGKFNIKYVLCFLICFNLFFFTKLYHIILCITYADIYDKAYSNP
jgi:hypothetical protein